MNNKRIVALLFGAASLYLGGCATVTRGTTDNVMFTSEPMGAEINLSDGRRCLTPCSLEIKRNVGSVDVTATLAGHDQGRGMLTSKIAGTGVAGVAGNVILGGVIGVAVDAGTGAMNDIVPNPMHFVLTKSDEGHDAP